MPSVTGGGRIGTLTPVLIAVVAAQAMAQSPAPPPAKTRVNAQVTVDLTAGAFDRDLPFDVPFFISGRAPEGTVRVEVHYAVAPPSGDLSTAAWTPGDGFRWMPERATVGGEPFLVLVRAPLEPRRRYLVRFTVTRDRVAGVSTFTAEGRTSQKNYVNLDLGLAYAGDIETGAIYVGGNIHFRPINKDAPLGPLFALDRRASLTAGVTLSPIADEGNRTRSDLFWHQSLVVGGGYRLAPSVRAGVGALLFRAANPNPLITRKSAAATWFVSFSFDLDTLKR